MGQRFHGPGPGHMEMPGHMMGYSMFNIIWLIVLIIAVLLIVILLIRLILTTKKHNEQPKTQKNKAIEILQERYARGELSEDEYRQKLQVLKED